MNKELVSQFQGKVNVTKVTNDNGSVSYMSSTTSFAEEADNKGACIMNTYEKGDKHAFFLFNDAEVEVGRYYLTKNLQGKSLDELCEIRHSLVFFSSWREDTKEWVPCVALSTQENLAHSGMRF